MQMEIYIDMACMLSQVEQAKAPYRRHGPSGGRADGRATGGRAEGGEREGGSGGPCQLHFADGERYNI